jgi:hypothetical protein
MCAHAFEAERGDMLLCPECERKYRACRCSLCGTVIVTSQPEVSSVCRSCAADRMINSVPEASWVAVDPFLRDARPIRAIKAVVDSGIASSIGEAHDLLAARVRHLSRRNSQR